MFDANSIKGIRKSQLDTTVLCISDLLQPPKRHRCDLSWNKRKCGGKIQQQLHFFVCFWGLFFYFGGGGQKVSRCRAVKRSLLLGSKVQPSYHSTYLKEITLCSFLNVSA